MQGIVDAHFHIWRQKDLPWLNGPMVPRIFGPYEPIMRDYPITEYLGDLQGEGVEKAVYVQTNWTRDDYEKEVAWVSETANEYGWPHAIVGYADMTVKDVRPQLDRLKAYPLMRGVRMQLHWHDVPEYRFAASARQVIDPAVSRNVAHLKNYGLSFDLQLFPGQMEDGAQLVADNPGTDFILTHAGMLVDDRPATVDAWHQGLCRFAGMDNFHAKLSGLGTFVHANDPTLVQRIIDDAIDILGSEHLMFGSNFPIEKLWTDYRTLLTTHKQAVDGHGVIDMENIFRKTATRVYRLA
ncbi:amidohydrolase family protein [Sinorhizobium sp. BG8]|uniref:amidohydrolase family protein n=1 Tax=Sinorhizobium sp. BG8 TaxID=2613773 RepID=UPI00193CD3F1|nr:amidohydrolase family protein [Sinorhizobium sp. BG8]QRM57401.1 amidohydrolase family protein [Sinorhizobium sp. BG8]